jgi:hypothetical protein
MLKTGDMRRRRSERDHVSSRFVRSQIRWARSSVRGNRKGCDIGYAPATDSYERALSVDACTIAALDAITASAVPNPNCSSQKPSVFSGLVALQVALPSRSLSLLRIGKLLCRQSFQPSTPAKLNSCLIDVNAILGTKTKYL